MSHQSDLIAQDIQAYLQQQENKQLVKFLTCGSVDDGKSTLIGRLLHDSKMIYEDQLAAIEKDSKKMGTTGEEIDLALLVDGLQSEREQGITIDVAYRYFSTSKRKFIIADTPGHEQYTRNMATGASTCDLAIILVDARHGIVVQTRRHAFICSQLGIKQLIVAVNKMDLVDFDQSRFNAITDEFNEFANALNVENIHFIPVSALKGDNVVDAGTNTPWYSGKTLMALLETVDVNGGSTIEDWRFGVQYVNRPNSDFRGYAGTIASGTINIGDKVTVLPSGKSSTVATIVDFDGEMPTASAPQAITVTLEDEIDISRGEMLVKVGALPQSSDALVADVVWMHDDALIAGREYYIKHGSKLTVGHITGVEYRVNVNTMAHEAAAELALNEMGRCFFRCHEALHFDPYTENKSTGAFIIIDRVSNVTVGAAMIVGAIDKQQLDARHKNRLLKSENTVWHPHVVTREQRAQQKNQRACVLWYTGLSGSGKSTIANAVERKLYDAGFHGYLLDGDNVRLGLSGDLGFSDKDRIENIRRIGEVGKLFVESGLIVSTAFISPFKSDRDSARALFPDGEFIEVFVDASLAVCEKRDTKGWYKKARAGDINDFTGIDSGYDMPVQAEIHLHTADDDVETCAEQVIAYLTHKGFIG